MKPFVHLHNHSEYSLLDGISRVDAIVARVKELGMDAYALTDHGVLYGVIQFYQAARKAGIKPIIGCEVYVARRRLTDRDPKLDRRSFHLTLLAKDIEGYRNLMKLVSIAHCEGFFYKPRVDFEALSDLKGGLICLSGCLNGPVSRTFLSSGEDDALRELERYAGLFKEDYYVELQRHGMEEQDRVREFLIGAATRMGLPMAATNDNHYLNRGDAGAHDIALCIGTKAKLADRDRMRYETKEYYIKSRAEMEKGFGDMPDVLDITAEIAEKCDLELPLGKICFPSFEIPEDRSEKTHPELLESLVMEGAKRRYGEDVPERILARVKGEIEVIVELGFATYFLIVWDFIRFARTNGIPVGPGRGSGAGSCVAYCLEITDVDPIRFELLFERFLNRDRVSLPDFDIDFCMDRREEVIEYVRDKYGEDNVAQLVTFNHMKAKAVLKNVGRVMDLPFKYVNEVTKTIPRGLSVTIDDALRESPDLAQMMDDDPQVKKLVEEALKLEGLVSYAGVHAAGVVIADGKLEDFVPVQKSPESDMRVAQYDLSVIEAAGLVKMDFLGLRTLTMLDEAVKLVKEFEGVEIDLRNLDFSDERTFKLFRRGDTLGVFQFEREAVRRVLREANPQSIEDISTINGLNRPGPSANTTLYIENKRNPKRRQYVIPELKDVLDETAGILIYQEQVMEAVRKLAGFTLGQADILRRAMGKKDAREMGEMKANFIRGCTDNGLTKRKAEEYFGLIETFAGYGFNKCHSLPYSVISYQTAYMKAHYPLYFVAALINSYIGSTDYTAKYIRVARKMDIKVLKPDINRSEYRFRPEAGGVRFGLAGLKGVGRSAIQAILSERERGTFKDVGDFIHRMDARAVTRAVIEALVKGGALDELDPDRGKILSDLDRLCDRRRDPRQEGLFTGFEEEEMSASVLDSDYTMRELAEFEQEVLGVCLKGHPLEDSAVLKDPEYMNPLDLTEWISENLDTIGAGAKVELSGVLGNIRHAVSRSGNEFAKADLSDTEESLVLVIFSRLLKKVRRYLVDGNEVVVTGSLEFSDSGSDEDEDVERFVSGTSILVDSLTPYSPPREGEEEAGEEDEAEAGGTAGDVFIEFSLDVLGQIDLHEFCEEVYRGGGDSRLVIHISSGGTVLREIALPERIKVSQRGLERMKSKYRFRLIRSQRR